MRLAELYLSYAEADFEYSGTLSTASLSYLNKVRERCGLPTFADSWAKAGGIPSGEKLREILHDERSIELAMEGRRFHDMRRWKIAHTEMMRYQKSWTLSGKTADSFYKLTDMKETGYIIAFRPVVINDILCNVISFMARFAERMNIAHH
jgi:starch-binding outer membrane protein, SusD/RagB family